MSAERRQDTHADGGKQPPGAGITNARVASFAAVVGALIVLLAGAAVAGCGSTKTVTVGATTTVTGTQKTLSKKDQAKQEADQLREMASTNTDSSAESQSGSSAIVRGRTVQFPGAWSVTVKGLRRAKTLRGYETHTAKGVYVLLDLSVTNETTRPIALGDYSAFAVVDTEGRLFTADGDATIDGLGVERSLANADPLQPGLPERGIVVFDVPASATISSVRVAPSPDPLNNIGLADSDYGYIRLTS